MSLGEGLTGLGGPSVAVELDFGDIPLRADARDAQVSEVADLDPAIVNDGNPREVKDALWRMAELRTYHPDRLRTIGTLRDTYRVCVEAGRPQDALDIAADLAYFFGDRDSEEGALGFIDGVDVIEAALEDIPRGPEGMATGRTINSILKIFIARARADELQPKHADQLFRAFREDGMYGSIVDLQNWTLSAAVEIELILPRNDPTALAFPEIIDEDIAARATAIKQIIARAAEFTDISPSSFELSIDGMVRRLQPTRVGMQYKLPGMDL